MSFFPESLKEVFTTGGIPPLLLDDPVGNYEATASWVVIYGRDTQADAAPEQVAERNKIYYEKYPQDIKRVRLAAEDYGCQHF